MVPTRSGHKQDVTARNQNNTRNRLIKITGEDNDTGIQHRGNNAGHQNTPDTQDPKTEFAAPDRPVQGVIGIFRRLWREYDAHIPSSGMF